MRIEDDAPELTFHGDSVEVETEAQPQVAESQVDQHLGNMLLSQGGDRFEFDHQLIADKYVSSSAADQFVLVNDIHALLAHMRNTAQAQFMRQGILI